ncbi:MAG: hypothetical protein K1W30_14735 [Lachnospiraceae bacterium]
MRVKFKVKQGADTVGYILGTDNENQDIYVAKSDIEAYEPDNADRLSNGQWRAKKGYCIQTIDIEDLHIQNRNTPIVGKPDIIYNFSFGRLSLTQQKILNMLNERTYIIIDKKKENLKITMKDLSALTAYTGIEYALFERNDKYAVYKGNSVEIILTQGDLAMLLNGKYQWIGHAHPGNSYNCLIPSDGDYNTLAVFKQKQSVIYNSVGDYYVFGEES